MTKKILSIFCLTCVESSFTELGEAKTLALMLGIDLNDVNQAERAISVVNDVVSGKEDGDGVGIIR
jgi:hypothetical protein